MKDKRRASGQRRGDGRLDHVGERQAGDGLAGQVAVAGEALDELAADRAGGADDQDVRLKWRLIKPN